MFVSIFIRNTLTPALFLLSWYSPGVYWLQDPRSRVFNFTPWLQTVPNVKEFAFSRVASFIKSSSDNVRKSSRSSLFVMLTWYLTGPLNAREAAEL